MLKKRCDLLKFCGFSEILILVLATFAFSFLIGDAGLVSAVPEWTYQGHQYVYDSIKGNFRDVTPGSEEIVIPRADFQRYIADGRAVQYAPPPVGEPRVPSVTSNAPPTDSGGSAISTILGGAGTAFAAKNAFSGGQELASDVKITATTGETYQAVNGVVKIGSVEYNAKDLVDAGFGKVALPNTPVTPPSASGSSVSGPFFNLGTTESFFADNFLTGLIWAGAVAGGVQLIGSLIGLDPNLVNSLTYASAGGIIAGNAAHGLALGSAASIGIGIAVGAIIFLLTYKEESKKFVQVECLPWQPAIGGADCEKCNQDPFRPCSEYRCKALGQACELLNPGTAKEQCAWVVRNDVKSPIIRLSDEALAPKSQGLKYVPDTAVRPPAIGFKIVKGNNGCLQAFTPLQFGVNTDEPAQCKVDYTHTDKFEQMQFYLGESNYFEYNHTQKMSLPAPEGATATAAAAATVTTSGATGTTSGTAGTGTTGAGAAGASGAPVLKNDGTFTLFIRCMDANGNQNVDEFAVRFCVDKSPDTTQPLIDSFSIASGSPVAFNSTKAKIDAYTNEPAQCKWSTESKAYELMENNMNCLTKTYLINSNLEYACSSELNGIKDGQDNKFYFRCKDLAENVNTQSKELVLRGTQKLVIDKVGPNETVFGSTNTVPVNLTIETSNGENEGNSICSFSPTEGSYIKMFETKSFKHRQRLDLGKGDYTYFFKCEDAGGNLAYANTSFSVSIDQEAPKITRVYRSDAEGLKIVTDEDAECVYDIKDCNYDFSKGIALSHSNANAKKTQCIEWKP